MTPGKNCYIVCLSYFFLLIMAFTIALCIPTNHQFLESANILKHFWLWLCLAKLTSRSIIFNLDMRMLSISYYQGIGVFCKMSRCPFFKFNFRCFVWTRIWTSKTFRFKWLRLKQQRLSLETNNFSNNCLTNLIYCSFYKFQSVFLIQSWQVYTLCLNVLIRKYRYCIYCSYKKLT